ncbi:MAG: PQQ-dependent sugar dehydrogenase [Labilithrix sp.]|nr:PQQ-dependent sugar dehydrogenase [Labilithrix sp.]
MKLDRRSRSRAARALPMLTLPLTLLACAGLASRGEDRDEPPGSSSSGGPPPGGSDARDASEPVERRPFPLTTPSLGGYALVDAFPSSVSLTLPSAIDWPDGDDAAPFVLERTGTIVAIEDGTARRVLDIASRVALVSESGALGMALHPAFGDGSGPSPYVYLWYNARGTPKNTQRLSRFTWSPASRTFDPASEAVLVAQEEERPEHNAGRIQFGPDGFLYFGNGDDLTSETHQRIDRGLFGGIFRIDVDSRGGAISHPPPRQPASGATSGYYIPNDNPFVGTPGALEEYFALGLRNPFGFSFDRATGALWAADVGDTWREEIDLVVAGGNYEWPHREGDLLRGGPPTTIGTPRAPAYVYTHAEMGDLSAVLGGFVYRGQDLPELAGKYVFSDWPSNRIWALDTTKTPATRATLVDDQWRRVPAALGEDRRGEIYVMHGDTIAKLARDPKPADVPRRLSETILFEDVATLTPDPSLVPYEINAPLWSDAATKQRWIHVPAGERVALADDGSLEAPVGTVFVKHFELPASVTPKARTRRLETRVLVVGDETTYGLTYRWNAAGTDAELLHESVDEVIEGAGSGAPLTWSYPSFGQCWSCHRAENRVLGFTAGQLRRTAADGESQLAALALRGVLSESDVATWPPALAVPSDAAASLEERATAYLAANCSGCHHAGASYLGGGQTWNASPGVALAERGLVGAPHHNYPTANALGLGAAPLVAPGNPDGSFLLARMKSTDPDLRMPPLGRNVVDPEGVLVVEQWIRSLSAGDP